jgi:hypothetical protein
VLGTARVPGLDRMKLICSIGMDLPTVTLWNETVPFHHRQPEEHP